MSILNNIKCIDKNKKHCQQLLKFATVGLCSTVINYIIFISLYKLFSINYTIAAIIGYVVGVFSGYKANKNWSFDVVEKKNDYLPKYFLTYFISMVVSIILLRALVEVLNILPEIANIMTISLCAICNFLIIKLLVFHR